MAFLAVAEMVENIEQNGLFLVVEPFDLVDGDEIVFGGGVVQRGFAHVDIQRAVPRMCRLPDPCLQNVAFARTLFAPQIKELVVILLQDVDEFCIGVAQEFVKARIGGFVKIERELWIHHGNGEMRCGNGGLYSVRG